jgi:hypothetical protein
MNRNDALIAVMRMIDEYEEFGYVHSKLSNLHDLHNFITSLGKNIDHETGLVPCGCGGKAELHPAGGVGNNDVMAECTTCSVAVICVTKEEAIRVWNEAMGYKEDEE